MDKLRFKKASRRACWALSYRRLEYCRLVVISSGLTIRRLTIRIGYLLV